MGTQIPGMQFILARRETGDPLVIGDPQPVDDVQNVWTSIGWAAIIGIFLILFGAFLYIGRVILLPTFAAAVISLTLAPVIEAGRRRGIPPWISSVLIVLLCLGALSLAAMALAGPVSEWIGRAPEIGATIKQKFAVFEQPLSSLRQLETVLVGNDNVTPPPAVASPSTVVFPVLAFLTPTVAELVLFLPR